MEKGTGHRVISRAEGYGYLMLTLPDLDAASRLRALVCLGGSWISGGRYQDRARTLLRSSWDASKGPPTPR